jgi:hypothetical protein
LAKPVQFPSVDGAFPPAILPVVPPVALDANRLRDDLMYCCGKRRRTTVVNAANAGLVRLFCARRVIGEVARHSQDWTDDTDVSRQAFLRSWATEYLPLIRVIQDDAVPPELMTRSESARARCALLSRPS